MKKSTCRVLAIVLLFAMVLALTACGSGSSTTGQADQNTSSGETNVSSESGSPGESGQGGGLRTGVTHQSIPWRGGSYELYETAQTGTLTKKTPADTLIVGGTSVNFTCDPAFVTDDLWCYNVYDSLLIRDLETNELKGLLATDWYYDDDDNLHLILREGVKFHDGTEFDAEDVMFTFRRLTDPLVSTRTQTAFSQIDFDNSRIENSHHVVVVFKSPVGIFLSYLASGLSGIMSKDFMESVDDDYSFLDGDAGCGAYKLVETVTGTSQTFEAFEDYWGGAPSVKTVIYRHYGDQTALFIDFINGEIDIANNNNYDTVTRILNGEVQDMQLYQALATRTNSLFLQTLTPPTNDIRVRQAIAYAIDQTSVLMVTYQDESMAYLADTILPVGTAHRVSQGPHVYDPDKAIALLKEAGYDENNPLELKMATSSTPASQTMMETCLNFLLAIGIKAELTTIDATVVTQLPNEATGTPRFDIIQNEGPQSSGDPDEYLGYRACYGKDPGTFSDYTGITDKIISDLIVEGGRTIDENRRSEIYAQIQAIFRDECYIIPMAQRRQALAVRDYVDGFSFYNPGAILLRYITINPDY